jgi:hypothetical protein
LKHFYHPHIKFWWYRTMLNFCGIVVAILKMATSRNCSMSGINSGHWFLTLKNFYRSPFSKWPPQYHTISTLSDFNVISYVCRLWCPELIPDIEKFLPVTIFKMCRESIQDITNLPTYQILMISDSIEFLRYCGGHFENGEQ